MPRVLPTTIRTRTQIITRYFGRWPQTKIVMLEKQTNLWGKRNISIEGKMLIVRTFAMSQLVFISQCMNINNK